MDRYEVKANEQRGCFYVLDNERSPRAIAEAYEHKDALHICQALNGFNALIAAVKS